MNIMNCKAMLGRGQHGLMVTFMNHAPGAGSIAQPIDQLTSKLATTVGPPCCNVQCIGCYEVALQTYYMLCWLHMELLWIIVAAFTKSFG